MQDEPRNPGADARKEPTNGTAEEVNARADNLKLVNIIQQNAVIITGRKVKGGQPEPDESGAERWL